VPVAHRVVHRRRPCHTHALLRHPGGLGGWGGRAGARACCLLGGGGRLGKRCVVSARCFERRAAQARQRHSDPQPCMLPSHSTQGSYALPPYLTTHTAPLPPPPPTPLGLQGSDNVDHWRVNLTFDPVPFEDAALGVRVHRGVYEAATALYHRFLPLVQDHLASHPFAQVGLVGGIGGCGSWVLLLEGGARGGGGCCCTHPWTPRG
jgi:hypothetical protein